MLNNIQPKIKEFRKSMIGIVKIQKKKIILRVNNLDCLFTLFHKF